MSKEVVTTPVTQRNGDNLHNNATLPMSLSSSFIHLATLCTPSTTIMSNSINIADPSGTMVNVPTLSNLPNLEQQTTDSGVSVEGLPSSVTISKFLQLQPSSAAITISPTILQNMNNSSEVDTVNLPSPGTTTNNLQVPPLLAATTTFADILQNTSVIEGETTATNALLQVMDDEIRSQSGTTMKKEAGETLGVAKAAHFISSNNTLTDQQTAICNIIEKHQPNH